MRTTRLVLRFAVWAAVFFTAAEFAHAVPLTDDIKSLEEIAPELFAAPDGGEESLELQDIRAKLHQALESFQRRDYDQSLAQLQAAVEHHDLLPPARLMLARLFIRDQQYGNGRAALEQAAAEDPTYPGIYVTFGALALSDGRLTDAAVHLERAMSLSEEERWALQRENLRQRIYAGLAAIAAQRADWASAKTHLLAWLELDPKNGRIRQKVAQTYFRLGQEEMTFEELLKAVADDPGLEPAAISMGWLYAEEGDLAKAGEWMETAVERDPDDPRTHRALATILLRQGEAAQAKKHAENAARLDADSNETKVLRGLIARYVRDYAEAEAIFQALQQESPTDSSLNNQLALVLVEQPDEPKQQLALHLAETNAGAFPDSPEALSTLGWVYYKQGRLDEAERALLRAMSSGVSSPDASYYLARVMFDRNGLDEIRRLLEEALNASDTFMFRRDAQELLERVEEETQ